MNLKVAAFLSAMLVPFTSQAGFIELDWKTEGDSLGFVQESTGIEWLSLTVTSGMSINEVLSETEEGGLYEGWRIASSSDVNTLMDEVFPTYDINNDADGKYIRATEYSGGDYWPYDEIRLSFSNLFDWTSAVDKANFTYTYYKSYGLYMNDYEGLAQTSDFLLAGTNFYRAKSGNSTRYHKYFASIYEDYEASGSVYTSDFKSDDTGVFLISDGGLTISSIADPSLNANNIKAPTVNVSAPVGLSAFGAALFGIAVFRRKNK